MILFGLGRQDSGGRAAAPAPAVASVSRSETGLVRADNQDRIFVDDARGVYCVADGVGGGSEGAYASEMVCANLNIELYAAGDGFASRV